MNYFADALHPIRCSYLSKIVACPMQAVLSMDAENDLGGVAAQTGNLAHLAVAAFHLEQTPSQKVLAGLNAIQAGGLQFPDGDLGEARRHFERYSSDPRNADAKVIAVEKEVALRLPAHSSDPTGLDIFIRGTLDQIRELPDGRLAVFDLKTGKPTGWQMLHDYAIQQSAYVLAARASGFPTAVPGALIRTSGYGARTAVGPAPDGVFFWMSWTVEQCEILLDRVRLEVARIRAGQISFGPGTQCTFCAHGGLQGCLPKAEERKLLPLTRSR